MGIGLRGSAALAKLSMAKWDITWAFIIHRAGIVLNLLYRYVDDIRIYMRPLIRGWY